MKNLIPLALVLVPTLSWGSFSKPQLLARFSDTGAFNAPDNMWCFSGEPAAFNGEVYLNCFDEKSYLMARWGREGFTVAARADSERLFSFPLSSWGKVNWYEYDEYRIHRSYVSQDEVTSTPVRNLGPLSQGADSFLPYSTDSWIYRLKGDAPELWIWKNDQAEVFFNPGAAFIYTPQVGAQGEIAFKTRDGNYSESSPDRLWLFDGSWKVVLEDHDANPSSPWLKIRHQLSVEGNKVVAIAQDKVGEALILIEAGKTTVLARAGVDLKSFDYFTPKVRAGVIVVRGMDHEGRKVTYVHDADGFRRLLTQGDIVTTELGPARVHYQNQDALFYGAPGIDERGSVYLQATLTDADHPTTLLGIGLINFIKE